MEEPGGGGGLVAEDMLAGSHSGERAGPITEHMEETPEGLFVCRGPSYPTSTLACRRDGHPPSEGRGSLHRRGMLVAHG